MTARDLASLLQAHGAYAAILLAGSSSAALAVAGALASSPSDGVERSVANVLALRSTPGAARYAIVGVAYGDYVGGTERVANPTVELRTLSGFTIEDAQSSADAGGYFETIPVLARSYHIVVGAAGHDRTCVQTIDETGGLADCGGAPCRWSSVRLLQGDGSELGCPPIACGPPAEVESPDPACGDPDGGKGDGGCGCRVPSPSGAPGGLVAVLLFAMAMAMARVRSRRQ